MVFFPNTPWDLVGLLVKLLGSAWWAAEEREEREERERGWAGSPNQRRGFLLSFSISIFQTKTFVVLNFL
jgi:hypothetical protein